AAVTASASTNGSPIIRRSPRSVAAEAPAHPPESSRWAHFLSGLHEGLSGTVELRALPSRAQAFLPSPGDRETIERFVTRHRGENCFVGVATRAEGATSGTLDDCRDLATLWVDVDFKTTPERDARAALAGFSLGASALVGSGGGFHAYWLLGDVL